MNTKEKTTDEYTLLVWKRCVCVCKDRTEPLPHVNNTEEYHYRNKHAQTHPHSLSTHIQYITAVLNIRDIHKVRVCVQSSLVRGPLLWMFLMIAWTTSEVVPCPPMSAVCNCKRIIKYCNTNHIACFGQHSEVKYFTMLITEITQLLFYTFLSEYSATSLSPVQASELLSITLI